MEEKNPINFKNLETEMLNSMNHDSEYALQKKVYQRILWQGLGLIFASCLVFALALVCLLDFYALYMLIIFIAACILMAVMIVTQSIRIGRAQAVYRESIKDYANNYIQKVITGQAQTPKD